MFFCKHQWNKVSENIGESVVEHMRKVGYKGPMRACDMYELTRKKIVIVLTCSKCGKVKTIEKFI